MDDDSLRLDCRFPLAASFFLVITLVLVGVGAIQQHPDWFIGAIVPFLISIGLWMIRPLNTTFAFGPDSVTDELHDNVIRYDEILGLSISGRTLAARDAKMPGGRLIISTADRNHEFPGLSRNTVRRAYEMLLDRIPDSGSREVVPDLEVRLNNDLQMFDGDLVYSYRARPAIPFSQLEVRTFLLAIFLGGLIWMCFGIVREINWPVLGACTASIAFVCWVIALIARQRENKQVPSRHLAGLIISPRGMALQQGPLKGELKWSEVKSVSCGRAATKTFVINHPNRSISVNVVGAEILIHDIYDRPLATIYRCIQRYWEAQ